jgi:hypothetical protein
MWGLGNDWLVLGPNFSVDVEGVDVAECNTSVVKTTVTSVDEDLVFV